MQLGGQIRKDISGRASVLGFELPHRCPNVFNKREGNQDGQIWPGTNPKRVSRNYYACVHLGTRLLCMSAEQRGLRAHA